MNKAKRAAVIAGTLFLCAAAYVAGSYAKEKLIEEVVQEMKRQQEPQESQEPQQEPQAGYILIHTTDGKVWGFYGSDGMDGGDIDMSGWLVGSTHGCYNQNSKRRRWRT